MGRNNIPDREVSVSKGMVWEPEVWVADTLTGHFYEGATLNDHGGE